MKPAAPMLPAAPVWIQDDWQGPRHTAEHAHDRAQLLLIRQGVLSLQVDGLWLTVPAGCAVWLPAGVVHAASGNGPLAGCSLYLDLDGFDPQQTGALPATAHLLQATPLLTALLGALARSAMAAQGEAGPVVMRQIAVLLDELAAAPVAPFVLQEPRDPRLRRIVAALQADPADGRGLGEWSGIVGATPRTLLRRFRQETGLSWQDWRWQWQLLLALRWLADGASVESVARQLGFAEVASFSRRFRASCGAPPSRYQGKASPLRMSDPDNTSSG